MSATTFDKVVKLATAAPGTGEPFSYLHEVTKDGVKLYLNSGIFQRTYLIQENISSLVRYLRDLLSMKFSNNIEFKVMAKGCTVSFGIYNHGPHPANEVTIDQPEFRVGDLYAPLSCSGYLYKFLTDIDNVMTEYAVLSGVNCAGTFEPPGVKVSFGEFLTVTLSTPRFKEAGLLQQTSTFGRFNLIGLLDMLECAHGVVDRRGAVEFSIRSPKIYNTLTRSSSQQGWVFNSSNIVHVHTVEGKFYIDNYMIAPLIEALKTALATQEKWITGAFAGEDFESAKLYEGSRCIGGLINFFKKEEPKKEEVKCEEEVKREKEEVKREKEEVKPTPEVKKVTKYDSKRLAYLDGLKYPLIIPGGFTALGYPRPITNSWELANWILSIKSDETLGEVWDYLAKFEPKKEEVKAGKSAAELYVEGLIYPLTIPPAHTKHGVTLQFSSSGELLSWVKGIEDLAYQLKIWNYLFSLMLKQA